MLTPDEAEALARDAMVFFSENLKDAGLYSVEFEQLVLRGAFRTWTREQRLEMANSYAPETDDFATRASIGTPAGNMAKLYLAWLLRNTGDNNEKTVEGNERIFSANK